MRGPRISLRIKLALSVSLLLIVVAGAVAFALIRYQRFFLLREGDKRVRALANNLGATARDPLLAGDDLRLGLVTQSVMRYEDASYAFIVDHQGTIVYHPEGTWIGTHYPDPPPPPSAGVLQAASSMVVEGTVVGTAVVGLEAGFIEEALRTTARGLLVPLTLGTLAGVAGLFVLTGWHVKRLETLETAVQALGSGDLLVQAEVGGRDEVSRLASHFNRMVGQLESARRTMEGGFAETVSALAAAIEAKDAYTRGHCDRVAKISRAIAERLGIAGSELRDLELAAILHDVGKIGVRANVLGKDGRLDEAEMKNMRRHPAIGMRILSPLSFLGEVGTYVLHHHERYDGSGYPEGLAGEAIPLPSRIIHLVDAYDAMTSSRPYRSALPHDEALARIVKGGGSQFDPRLVELFLTLDREGVIAAIRREVAEMEAT